MVSPWLRFNDRQGILLKAMGYLAGADLGLKRALPRSLHLPIPSPSQQLVLISQRLPSDPVASDAQIGTGGGRPVELEIKV